MTGPTAVLAKAAIEGTELPTTGMVPSFVRAWRPVCNDGGNWGGKRLLTR